MTGQPPNYPSDLELELDPLIDALETVQPMPLLGVDVDPANADLFDTARRLARALRAGDAPSAERVLGAPASSRSLSPHHDPQPHAGAVATMDGRPAGGRRSQGRDDSNPSRSRGRGQLHDWEQIAAATVVVLLVGGLLAAVLRGRSAPGRPSAFVPAAAPAAPGVLAFASNQGGTNSAAPSHIYTIETDGSHLRQLTGGPKSDGSPVWSPDGQRIAFVRGNGASDLMGSPPPEYVYVMNADGSGLRNLTPQGAQSFSQPIWSPDGTQIASTCPTAGNLNALCLIAADGSSLRSIVPNSLAVFPQSAPAWSPDGKRIAFTVCPTDKAGPCTLYVVDADGSNLRALHQDVEESATLAWSPDGGTIAITSSSGARDGLMLVNADGSGWHQVDDGDHYAWDPVWSLDGQQVFFTAWPWTGDPTAGSGPSIESVNIYRVNRDGSGLRMVIQGLGSRWPSWSPDRREIAYIEFTISGHTSLPSLHVANADGSHDRTILEDTDAPGTGPADAPLAWRPAVASPATPTARAPEQPARTPKPSTGSTARTIADLGLSPVPCPPLSYPAMSEDIYVMNADGTGQRRLTSEQVMFPQSPVWSPDGKLILFTAEVDQQPGIFVMRPDGSGLHRLIGGLPGDYMNPVWSPDDKEIAFGEDLPLPDGYVIEVMNTDGSNVRRLTHTGQDERPAWSPDGKEIAFTSYRDGNDEVYVMNADGSDQRNITRNPARDEVVDWLPDGRLLIQSNRGDDGPTLGTLFAMSPDGSDIQSVPHGSEISGAAAWSPDGTRIAYTGSTASNENIFLMNADGSGIRDLTNSGANDSDPAWSPDGRQIVFMSDRDRWPMTEAGATGQPEPMSIAEENARGPAESGGFGPYCWMTTSGQGNGGTGAMDRGIAIPAQPLEMITNGRLGLDFAAIGSPRYYQITVYNADVATRLGKVNQGVFLPPCAPPGGTEGACIVRQLAQRVTPGVKGATLNLNLPSGHYFLVVTADFDNGQQSGRSTQGFNLVVVR